MVSELETFSKIRSSYEQEVNFMNYKQTALDALRGNWKTAMLTGFVASLFGATTMYSGGSSRSRSENSEAAQSIIDFFSSPEGQSILGIAVTILVIAVIFFIVSLFIGGAMRLGYARFNLNLIDRKPAVFRDLFSQMDRKWVGFCMNFLTGLYLALWSLLLVIPGIVKTYSYAMTPFILSENPDMPANEAITASRELMDGHKWDLFCLYLSFIGWNILVILPGLAAVVYTVSAFMEGRIGAGIAGFVAAVVLITVCSIPLVPYMEAANAAFYRDLAPQKKEEPAADWYLPE